jgi:lipopolysaccharide transport system ATP-binding protein
MSNSVIKTENLGKSYMIGHKSEREEYTALRDVISNKAKEVWSRIKNPQYYTHQNLEEFWALNDVNLDVKDGDRLGIIGRNGAGKTTLLKVLSRITEPTAGRAIIRGRIASLLEVGTGFHPELTGRENVYLNGSILGMSREEIKRKFDEIVCFSGVEQFIDTPVKRYSSGMYVRLAFAVAAHIEPEILIVDEVLSVGDAEFQKKAIGKMEDVTKDGRTVIFVSHNLASVSLLCNRALLLNQGTIMEEGTPDLIINNYLENRSANNSIYEWNDPETAPGNDVLRLRSAKILSSKGEVSSEIDIKDEFSIEITYWNLKNDTRMWAAIHVFNIMNVLVLTSSNTPTETLNIDPLWDTPQPIGIYKTVCQIPKRLLNASTYFVNIAIGINSTDVLVHEERLLEFDIYDTISQVQKIGKAHNSVIRPQLEWETALFRKK